MSDLSICNVECGFKDIAPNPFSEFVSFDMVLRVRAIAARSDILSVEHRFRERAKALVENIKKEAVQNERAWPRNAVRVF